jgi:hypothetical protein
LRHVEIKNDKKGGMMQHLVGGEKGPAPRREMFSGLLELMEKDLAMFHMWGRSRPSF